MPPEVLEAAFALGNFAASHRILEQKRRNQRPSASATRLRAEDIAAMVASGSLFRRFGPTYVRYSGRVAAAGALRRRQGPEAAARDEATARRVAAGDLAAWEHTVLAAGPALHGLHQRRPAGGLTPEVRAWLLATHAAGELCACLHEARGILLDAVRNTDDDARAELLDGVIDEIEVAEAHGVLNRAAAFFNGLSRSGVRSAFGLLDRTAALSRRQRVPLVGDPERDRVLRQILRVVVN